MPQLAGGGGGGDPELCATDEMIPFKDEGDPQKEQSFAEITNSEEEGDLAELKSSLVNESETSPNSNSHDVSPQINKPTKLNPPISDKPIDVQKICKIFPAL